MNMDIFVIICYISHYKHQSENGRTEPCKRVESVQQKLPNKSSASWRRGRGKKIRQCCFFYVLSKITHSRNKLDTSSPFAKSRVLGNIDQQEMIEADKSEKMHTSFKFQLYMYMSSTQGGVPNATDGQQIPLQGINDYTGMILKVRDDNIDRKESSKIMI